MTTAITSAAIALASVLLAANGAVAQTSTDTGSTPTAVTPTPSTGSDKSIRGGDTPSKPQQTIESPAASPKLPSSRDGDAATSTAPQTGGTGTLGSGTSGSPP
jgi:hypothetical protein